MTKIKANEVEMNVRPTREQLLASIEESTPHEMESCLKIEKKLKTLSGWRLRDEVKRYLSEMDSMVPASNEAMEEKDFLSVAWELLDFIREVGKLRSALTGAIPNVNLDPQP